MQHLWSAACLLRFLNTNGSDDCGEIGDHHGGIRKVKYMYTIAFYTLYNYGTAPLRIYQLCKPVDRRFRLCIADYRTSEWVLPSGPTRLVYRILYLRCLQTYFDEFPTPQI